MKIIKLTAENIKKVVVVEITPEGNLVEITGPNGSGKTSVLDSIYYALAGTKVMAAQPIHRGASEGHIELDLGDLIVHRKISQTGSTLTVERKADGVRLDKPQSILDSLLGKISFDPLAFSKMKPKDQFEQLRKLVDLTDLEKLDELNRSDFVKRTDLNREEKELRARAGPDPSIKLPDQKINVSDLTDRVQRAVEYNAAIDKELQHRKDIAANIENLRTRAQENARRMEVLKKQLAEEEGEMNSRIATAERLDAEMKAKPPISDKKVNVDEEKAKIKEAIEINNAIDREELRKGLLQKAAAAADAADRLTVAINDREEKKRAAIAAAKMPVPGLGFGKDEVLLNDLPFDQASDAEQLRASCAIAMAMNPKLRVLRIRDGSLLDSNGLKLLAEMAKENDFQCWIERVSDGHERGIVMEAGRVKHLPTCPSDTVALGQQ